MVAALNLRKKGGLGTDLAVNGERRQWPLLFSLNKLANWVNLLNFFFFFGVSLFRVIDHLLIEVRFVYVCGKLLFVWDHQCFILIYPNFSQSNYVFAS